MVKTRFTKIKQEHEEAVCKRFLSLYNSETQGELKFIRLGDPNRKEPVCICNNNIGLELVNKFDNSYQAEKMWSEARGIKSRFHQTLLLESRQQDFDRVIAQKLEKLNLGNYEGFSGKILLVYNLQSPLITDRDVAAYFQNYTSFKRDFDKYFDEIWITWQSDKNGEWKIKQLEKA